MTSYTIASGSTSNGLNLFYLDTATVLSDGTLDTATLFVGAEVVVQADGRTENTLIYGASSVIIDAGGLAVNTVIDDGDGGEQLVEGSASGTTIDGGCSETVENGGISYNPIIQGSQADGVAAESINTGGTVFFAHVESMGVEDVYSGGHAIDNTVDAGGYIGEALGGTIVGAVVKSAGIIALAGITSETTINNGGSEIVYLGGTADNSVVNGGGYQTVRSNGTASGTTINVGGQEFIQSGGILNGVIINGGTEIVDGTLGSDISFSGTSPGILQIGSASTILSGTDITAFATGDTIEVVGATSVTFSSMSGVLSFDDPTAETIHLYPAKNFSADTFHIAPLTGGGVEITLVPCFAAGTRILTPRGEIAVEALDTGDEVITASGNDTEIKWIGVRRLDLSRHPMPQKAQPIRLGADCFADGVPSRDLILSPDHALYFEGHLVPAKAMVNDRNIRQLKWTTVTYYHIELAEHSIIFAENTAVESYLDTGNRGAFQNASGAFTLHPNFAQTMREQKGCAPFAETGPVVEAVRMRTLQQFYMPGAADQTRRGSRS